MSMYIRERPRCRKVIENILKNNKTSLSYLIDHRSYIATENEHIVKNNNFINIKGKRVFISDGLVTQARKMLKE